VKLNFFVAKQISNGIELNWQTDESLVAVNVWRAKKDEEGIYFDIVKLNNKVIYGNTFIDKTADPATEFFYGLETIDYAGIANLDTGSIISIQVE